MSVGRVSSVKGAWEWEAKVLRTWTECKGGFGSVFLGVFRGRMGGGKEDYLSSESC